MKSMAEQMETLFGNGKKASQLKPSQNAKEPKPTQAKNIYKIEELVELDDEQLIALLREYWNIPGDKIVVWGKLIQVGSKDNAFVKLADVRNVSDNALLDYPVKTSRSLAHRGVYIHPDYGDSLYNKQGCRFIKCELELSAKEERQKHENPFLLNVKNEGAERLQELPLIEKGDAINNNDSTLISQAIYDFYINAKQQEFQQKEAEMHADLEQKKRESSSELNLLTTEITDVQHKVVTSINQYDALTEKNKNLTSNIQNLSQSEQQLVSDIESLKLTHKEVEKLMANKIQKLTDYIKSKATLLKDLEFIDSDDFDELILNTDKSKTTDDMTSFEVDLDADYATAVSYLQAHMLKQDILYPRHVIENFLTLIRTNDLIILAGDSGSGKTNLVQSFAKAVGGISKIIPVKPNWTSSEDLLGYYNPLEKKYLATPFLEALIEAKNKPDVPYFICLDEMNLARVEYYFADFLSKLEERNDAPVIELYSDSESAHVLSELTHVIDIIKDAKEKYQKNGITNFVKLMQDAQINEEMKRVLGFSDKDSLIKYHGDIRRMLSGLITTPSQLELPSNVRIIGAINIDETTHYLSPKILDRAHIMKFKSPLLSDWNAIIEEVDEYELSDVSKKLSFNIESLGARTPYPKFNKDNGFCQLFIDLNRDYFSPMGVEFGMRTIRQGLNYIALFKELNTSNDRAINNFFLHKVLPKFSFDGNKDVGNESTKADLLRAMLVQIEDIITPIDDEFSAINAYKEIISKAESNDWIVNYWS